MRQGAQQVLAQTRANPTGEGARLLQLLVEVVRVGGQPEGLELRRPPRRVLADEHEVAVVSDQHQAIAPPIAADLRAVSREPGVVTRRGLTSTTPCSGICPSRGWPRCTCLAE